MTTLKTSTEVKKVELDDKMKILLSFLLLAAFFSRLTISDGLQTKQTSNNSTSSINSPLTNNNQCSEYEIGEERYLEGIYANGLVA